LQINYMLTVGDQEIDSQTLSLRRRDNVVYGKIDLNSFLQILKREREDRALHSYFSQETKP
jgi:threonyl-tRNA synthetase